MKNSKKETLLTGVDNIKYAWKHATPYVLANIAMYLALIGLYGFLIHWNPTTFTIILNVTTAIAMSGFFLYITAKTGARFRMHHRYTRELREILNEIQNIRPTPIPRLEPTEAYFLFREHLEEDLPDENF